MDTRRAETMTKDLMKYHLTTDWRFQWDRAKRRRGFCKPSIKLISLSYPLTQLRTEDDVLNTILHEIAHALTPYHHHDSVWKAKAISLGCTGERCSTDRVFVPGKYFVSCPSGKHTGYRDRLPKPHRLSSCGQCSNRYDPRFVLVYKLTKEVDTIPVPMAAEQ